jgi:hypothetical protein
VIVKLVCGPVTRAREMGDRIKSIPGANRLLAVAAALIL